MLKGVGPRYARPRSQPARGPMPGGMPRRQQCRTTRSGCGPPAPRGDGVFSGQVLSGHRRPRGSRSRDETRLRARARRQSAREEATEQQCPCRNPWHPACCRTSVDGQGDSVRCSEFADAHPVQRPVHGLSCNVWIHSRTIPIPMDLSLGTEASRSSVTHCALSTVADRDLLQVVVFANFFLMAEFGSP